MSTASNAETAIKQDIQETENILEDFKDKNQKLKNVLKKAKTQFEKVSREEKKEENMEKQVLLEDESSIEEPTEEKIKKLIGDEKKELIGEYEIEEDLELGLKELREAEELTGQEIKELHQIILDIQEIIDICTEEIRRIVNSEEITGIKKIGKVAEQLDMATVLFVKLVEALERLEYDLEIELKENEEATFDLTHLVREIEGLEKTEKGDIELARETNSSLLEKVVNQMEKKINEEKQIAEKEEAQELENIQLLTNEISALEQELAEIIEEIEEFREDIKALLSYSENILETSNSDSARKIRKYLQDSMERVDSAVSGISEEREMLTDIESEMENLKSQLS